MKKLFGEYLVEQGVLSDEQLCQAIVEQVERLPSTLALVSQLQLLKASAILASLKLQFESGADFRSCCIRLSFWNQNIEHQVQEALKEKRIPIGELLVARGHLTNDQLVQHLGRFFQELAPSLNSEQSSGALTKSLTSSAPLQTKDLPEITGIIRSHQFVENENWPAATEELQILEGLLTFLGRSNEAYWARTLWSQWISSNISTRPWLKEALLRAIPALIESLRNQSSEGKSMLPDADFIYFSEIQRKVVTGGHA